MRACSTLDDSDSDNAPARRPHLIKERMSYFDDLDDVDFVKRFRLSKEGALHVLEKIENKLEFRTLGKVIMSIFFLLPQHTYKFCVLWLRNSCNTCGPVVFRSQSVAPVNQLLLCLRFYATGCTQLSAGDFSGVSESTAKRIVHRVSDALASLYKEHIIFPDDEASLKKTQLEFHKIARFPKVIGAVDCTHIKIKSPGGEQAEYYRCRKGFFPLNCQALLLALGLNVDLKNVFPIIIATAILHNILRRRDEAQPPDDEGLEIPMPWDRLIDFGQIQLRNHETATQDNTVIPKGNFCVGLVTQ
ncbi:hypothetical protein FOCC_FOCC015884 [Frankliniella occidentalis]|nr:hypothetical protein FOCC_FOCC015884 [Frankliniella occidentalis]